jgi:hypothetical protein
MYSVKEKTDILSNRPPNAAFPAPSISPYIEIANHDRILVFQITINLDGKPCRPKILDAIARSHPGYTLTCWWIPE